MEHINIKDIMKTMAAPYSSINILLIDRKINVKKFLLGFPVSPGLITEPQNHLNSIWKQKETSTEVLQ